VCLCGMLFVAQSAGLWLDVPYFKQEKDGCGAAVIAMVVQYWNQQQPGTTVPVDPVRIQKSLYSKRAHGIYASDLERYFQDHGFRTFILKATWEDFQHHLEKGRPLIVALKPLTGQTSLHYVVVVGVNPSENTILVNDPAQKKLLKMERPAFEKEWDVVQRWTLLALPK
jgi:ABC-type bacteriocin/lantibiotic exporter with double-glycine peptidase domain